MVLNIFNRDPKLKPGTKVDEYTILKQIGEGRYGICYLVNANNQQFILKQLKKDILKKNKLKSEYEEQILKKIHHKQIPSFVKKIENDKFSGYLLEYMAGKTFEEIIFADNRIFERKEIYSITRQLINILKYLHHLGIVHRDIRVPNTLYYQGNVYLVDYGLARWVNKKKYTVDVDFSFLGDFLLHLYYTSYEDNTNKSKPWYQELKLYDNELTFFEKVNGPGGEI